MTKVLTKDFLAMEDEFELLLRRKIADRQGKRPLSVRNARKILQKLNLHLYIYH